MPYMTANSYFGLGKETTVGTAVNPSTWTPIGSPKVTTGLKWLDDSDFRGSPVMHYDQVAGVRSDQFSGKTYLYADVFPQLIKAALGGTDTVASVAAGASTHTIGLLNSPTTGSQSPSYTVWNNSVDGQYQLTGSRLVDLSISFSADAAAEASFSFACNPASVVASVSGAPVESTQVFVPGWDVAASIGGSVVAVVESGTLDIKRSTAAIHTIGQQAPYSNFQGPLEVSGSLKFVVEANQNFFANALTTAQSALVLKFIDPASSTGNFIQFTMSEVQLEDPIIDQSKAYISLDTKFVATANTTDSGGSPLYSPIQTITRNGVSTAY